MQRQMELWPTSPRKSQDLEIWHTLDHQLQKDVVTALANLIRKMVQAEGIKLSQEVRHER